MGVVIGIGLAIFVSVLLHDLKTKPPVPNPGQGTATSTFPTPGPGPHPTNTISIKTKNSGSIQTKDFLKDSGIVQDPANEGYYFLGNHFIEGATEYPPYVIEYIEATNFFNIGLFQEPIARSRRDAEAYIMGHLGISQAQMCELRYMVSVPYNVNEFYTSMSLGFSFCPGSVTIPE